MTSDTETRACFTRVRWMALAALVEAGGEPTDEQLDHVTDGSPGPSCTNLTLRRAQQRMMLRSDAARSGTRVTVAEPAAAARVSLVGSGASGRSSAAAAAAAARVALVGSGASALASCSSRVVGQSHVGRVQCGGAVACGDPARIRPDPPVGWF
jgi:hypothetical protein